MRETVDMNMLFSKKNNMPSADKRAEALSDKLVSFRRPAEDAVSVEHPFDVYLFFTTLILTLIGILMTFSSSAILAQEKYGDTYFFLKRELFYCGLGLIGLFIVRKIPYRLYAKIIYPILGVVFLLMIMCLIPPFGYTAGGASRWLRFGAFTFQPSEIAKIAIVMFVAYMASKKGDNIRLFFKGFLPTILIAGAFLLLILAQKDLGSAFVVSVVMFIMLFVSGTHPAFLGGSIALACPGLYFLIVSESFRMRRILAFLNPWKYQSDHGFQIIQSFVALTSGGFWGVGLGESKQKLFYLPEAHTDFIFAVLGEEFGMLGVLVVIALFLLLIFRGLKIAHKTENPFGMFLALGITCLIGLQAFINFGVVMGMLPTKGLVLPFISYGGSSLVISLSSVGILLNISTQTGEDM